MAKVLKKHLINTVKMSFIKNRLLLMLCIVAVVICVAICPFVYFTSLILVPFLLILAAKIKRQNGILLAGAQGEKYCLDILKRLPKGFFIIPDITLCVGHKTAQLDYIVISKGGIFIIESKNHKGTISGNAGSKMLYKVKRFSHSQIEESEIYNPIRQVSTHARLMRELIGNLNIPIHSIVYFSHPEANIKINGDSEVSVFSKKDGGDTSLLNYILRQKSVLSNSSVSKLKQKIFLNCK